MPSPRILSLRDAGKSDARLVEDATKHILELLDDPYYFEAYQNLVRDKHPKLSQIVGRRRSKTGSLAAEYQNNGGLIYAVKTKMPKRGRPKTLVSENFDLLILKCKELDISLKEGCRRMVRGMIGSKPREDQVQKFYTIVSGYKRRKIAKLKN